MKEVHNLRLRKAAALWEIPYSERRSRLKLRLRESQIICSEFMDFFSMFASSFVTGRVDCPVRGATSWD
jgi:hypothetical protein